MDPATDSLHTISIQLLDTNYVVWSATMQFHLMARDMHITLDDPHLAAVDDKPADTRQSVHGFLSTTMLTILLLR